MALEKIDVLLKKLSEASVSEDHKPHEPGPSSGGDGRVSWWLTQPDGQTELEYEVDYSFSPGPRYFSHSDNSDIKIEITAIRGPRRNGSGRTVDFGPDIPKQDWRKLGFTDAELSKLKAQELEVLTRDTDTDPTDAFETRAGERPMALSKIDALLKKLVETVEADEPSTELADIEHAWADLVTRVESLEKTYPGVDVGVLLADIHKYPAKKFLDDPHMRTGTGNIVSPYEFFRSVWASRLRGRLASAAHVSRKEQPRYLLDMAAYSAAKAEFEDWIDKAPLRLRLGRFKAAKTAATAGQPAAPGAGI
jgi:hypothetical protein